MKKLWLLVGGLVSPVFLSAQRNDLPQPYTTERNWGRGNVYGGVVYRRMLERHVKR